MAKGYEIATRRHRLAPHFVARANSDSRFIPGRMYVHVYGLNDAFPFPTPGVSRIEQALNHSLEVIRDSRNLVPGLNNVSYVLSLVWGLEGDKMLDLIGVSGIDSREEPVNWPENPEFAAFVFRNRVYQPENKGVTCGDGAIMLGIEEAYRRRKRNLREYLENPPEIKGLSFHQL